MDRLIIETLATGDEVVNGDVVDSNSAFVSQKFVREGCLVTRHNALPDDRELLVQGLIEISKRADVCVCSGGLGPTEDDLTSEVAAQALGVGLETNPTALERMKARFEKVGYRLSPNNLRSVTVPKGAEVFQNEVGTAPAFAIQLGRCRFFFLPGVPKEFRFFVDQHVLPWLRGHLDARGGGAGNLSVVTQLKTLGIGESHLAEKFEDFPELFPAIKLGYRIHNPGVWLKLTAEGKTRDEAHAVLAPAVQEAEKRLGSLLYGRDEDDLVKIVHALLVEKQTQIVTAESCTGGLISQMFTANSGSSAYFLGGAVTYSNDLKSRMLGVPVSIFQDHGAVSRPCAEAMALGALDRFNAEISLAVTGIAGPTGGTPEKPVGLVYLAIGVRSDAGKREARVIERKFHGDRERVQRAAALTAVEMLRRQLQGLEQLA